MILESGTPADGGTPEPAAKDWRDAIRNAQTFGDIAAVFEAEFPADYAKYDYSENGVKAKKFKEWFGDWEKAALLGNMRYARGSDQAKAAAKEFIGVPLVNIDTGFTATVSGESLLKMLSKSAYERSVSVQAHMQAIANLDRLFQASAFRMSRDDRKGNENIKEIHHFDVPMKFDGEVLCVKIMAKEYTRKERGTRLYLVQAVEIGKPASCGEGLTSTQEMSSPVAAPPAGYGEKIAHLIDIVNGKITSKVVNPDGSPQETHKIQTPVPVYHGTAKAGFKEFDISKQDKTALYGPGFYFTENKDVAREYMGKEVVEWATIKEEFRDTFLKVFNMDVMDIGAGALSSDDNQQLFLSDGAVEHLVRDARGFLNSERIKIAMPLVAGKTEANRAVYSCFLNIRNPFDADKDTLDMQLLSRNEWMLLFPALVKFSDTEIDDFISKEIKRTTPGGYNYSLLEQQADSKAVANQVLQNVGYDGITHIGGNIMGGGKEHLVWIAFNPNQIKAVENQGTFDPSIGSILESSAHLDQKIETDEGETTVRKLLSRIARSSILNTKNKLYLSVYGDGRRALLEAAILKLPPGVYTLSIEGKGAPSLRSMIGPKYGIYAELDVNEKLVLGMAAVYPKKIKATFTLGLQEITIGKAMILESTVQPNQKPTIAQDQSKRAMKNTLDTQKNTIQGASRPDIGWIALLWGNTGTAPLFADGDGIARIIAKQDFEKKNLPSEQSGRELCMRLVDMLTRGHIKRKYGPSSRPKVDLSWQGEIATVSWDPDRKTWYLAAWREDWGGILESAAPAPAMAKDMLDDDPVMETAILEDGGDWKDMLRAATTFDDIYLAFKASGIMSEDMPNKPQDAITVFDHIDRLELLVSDYNVAVTAIQRYEISELMRKSMSEDRLITIAPGTLARMVSGYENVKPMSELSKEAGKEIFDAAKAKGEEIVDAWSTAPGFRPVALKVSAARNDLLSLEQERSAAELKYRADKSTLEDRLGYTKKLGDVERETAVAGSYLDAIANRISGTRAKTDEWIKLHEAYSLMAAETQERYAKNLKIIQEALDEFLASDEYQNLKSEYKTKEKSFSDKKQQLNTELSDALAKTYNPLIQKMLESSPITEKQANQWVSDQVIDKSAINYLAVEISVTGKSGTTTKAGYGEANIRKDMAELYRLSGGRFGKCHIQERFKGQPRACAEVGRKIIHVGAEFTKSTLWHEMGHLVEDDAKYVSVSNTFLDGRVDKTKGLIKLSVLTGNENYKDDEVAYTDHLFNAYVGKYYGADNSTEVFSMGIQQFSSPELMHELVVNDPEMFKMILGILATPPSGSEKEKFIGDLELAKAITDASKPIDAFYKMLDKKIKKNPLFYEPFATFQSVSGHKKTSNSDGYYIISKEWDSYGHYLFQFSAKSKQIVLQIAYLYLALEQSTLGDGATRDFKDWGQFNVINKDSIPAAIANVPSWVTDGLPDIKAA